MRRVHSTFPLTYAGWALAETGGARNTAAERLGMSRTTLWRKMKLYGLEGGDSVDVG